MIQYQVREIKRYVVTRYHETAGGQTGGTSTKGEYDNEKVAYEVAYALCKAEHDAAGTPPDDMGFVYPKDPASKLAAQAFMLTGDGQMISDPLF